MVDVEGDEKGPSSTPPPGKKQKKQQQQQHDEQEKKPSVPRVEYEDITAEVDARMQAREERKEREKKQELGIVDKRKRRSNDSFDVELGQQVGENGAVEKPSRKKKKSRHSGYAEG